MSEILNRQFDVIEESNKATLQSIPPTVYQALNVQEMNSRVGFRCLGIPKPSTLIVRRVDSVDAFGVPTSYTDFTRTTGVPTGTTYFVDEKFETAFILVDPSELGTKFEVQQENLGTPLTKEKIAEIQTETIVKLAPITGRLRASNKQDRIWNSQTISLNAGLAQIRNLEVNGACNVRANVTASTGILEVFGDITFAPGASLSLFKVLLIVHGNIIGDSAVRGVITSPNGANGGNASQPGSSAIIEHSGLGGTGIGGGGGGGGTSNGGDGGAFTSVGQSGFGFGSGAGGSSFNSSFGLGSGASEFNYIAAGGSGFPAPSTGGGGGGGGATWIKFLFFGNITNIIIRPGKGGIGGSGGVNGQGGQTGGIRAFFDRNLLTNVTFDVSAGTSTGNATRDGSAGELHLHDIESGQKSTVWNPPVWLNVGNIATSVQGLILQQEDYFIKAGAAI
ncbi:MAG: hypothetical protein O9346_01725 [Leptospiraceae bacterium]|jgi:hypothetical protein|nr:hypothetical protein [Leptospiraceae bacterium]